MCSTFKWLAAAFVLARVDRGEERLDRRVITKNVPLDRRCPEDIERRLHAPRPSANVRHRLRARLGASESTAVAEFARRSDDAVVADLAARKAASC